MPAGLQIEIQDLATRAAPGGAPCRRDSGSRRLRAVVKCRPQEVQHRETIYFYGVLIDGLRLGRRERHV